VPRPADGLWAILVRVPQAGAGPTPRVWPRCASPFWINRDSAVGRPLPPWTWRAQAPDQSYRTDYRLAAGEPVIAQIGKRQDGYLFLALTELARDEQGRLVAATGAAFGCAGGGPVVRSAWPRIRTAAKPQSPEVIPQARLGHAAEPRGPGQGRLDRSRSAVIGAAAWFGFGRGRPRPPGARRLQRLGGDQGPAVLPRR